MTYQHISTDGAPVKHWTNGVQFEEEPQQQVVNLAAMPFIHKHVAVMPDVHWGMGAAVGSVIATKGAIIPAAVGVDIGCGMMAARLNLAANDLPDNLTGVRSGIEAAVPHGRTANGGPADRGAWTDAPDNVLTRWSGLSDEHAKIVASHPKIAKARTTNHLGTLGSGNHFIELCLDENDVVWVMLHSGSRGIGNRIGSHFIALAKKDMERWFIHLPDKDLAYFPEGSEFFWEYMRAVRWAQEFALANRKIMMESVLSVLSLQFVGLAVADEAVSCHHNYVSQEKHFGSRVFVTRKGAVSARTGELGIIPGSMGASSYIVRGKGNRDSFHSCSHGAGRRMSRRQAREQFSIAEHEAATEGVECRKDEGVLDETPGAYKSIDAVMAAQTDLVDVVHTLRQVVCVKG